MSVPSREMAIAEAVAQGLVWDAECGEWVEPIVCEHQCTSDCRREGCKCACAGEFHEEANEPHKV